LFSPSSLFLPLFPSSSSGFFFPFPPRIFSSHLFPFLLVFAFSYLLVLAHFVGASHGVFTQTKPLDLECAADLLHTSLPSNFHCWVFACAPHHSHRPCPLPMPPFALFSNKDAVNFSFSCSYLPSVFLFYDFCFSFHFFILLLFVE
jgi:hypothetical protein